MFEDIKQGLHDLQYYGELIDNNKNLTLNNRILTDYINDDIEIELFTYVFENGEEKEAKYNLFGCLDSVSEEYQPEFISMKCSLNGIVDEIISEKEQKEAIAIFKNAIKRLEET